MKFWAIDRTSAQRKIGKIVDGQNACSWKVVEQTLSINFESWLEHRLKWDLNRIVCLNHAILEEIDENFDLKSCDEPQWRTPRLTSCRKLKTHTAARNYFLFLLVPLLRSSILTKTFRNVNRRKDRVKMSEEKLSSHKLDIEGAQRLSAGEEKLKESYRPISEDIGLTHGESSSFCSSVCALIID